MANYSNIFVNEGLTYEKYRQLIDDLLEKGETTGPDNSEAMVHYSKMNVQRMGRVEKTVVLTEALTEKISFLKKRYHLLIISEGWCGDAAQLVPLFLKITHFAPETFDMRLVLRDQHLDLIDAHLTNGGRAIPVVLILDEQGELLLKWGPRPEILQGLLKGWKAAIPDMFKVAEQLHLWYARDKTQTTQQELTALIGQLES